MTLIAIDRVVSLPPFSLFSLFSLLSPPSADAYEMEMDKAGTERQRGNTDKRYMREEPPLPIPCLASRYLPIVISQSLAEISHSQYSPL